MTGYGENGLPAWMHGRHPTWVTCRVCGTFVDPARAVDGLFCRKCGGADVDDGSRDMECLCCGGTFTRAEMHDDQFCLKCYGG